MALGCAVPALAEAAPPPKIDAADTAWMIAATALVLMMTIPGLALFYCGMVRKKNVLATMAQSLLCAALVLGAVGGRRLLARLQRRRRDHRQSRQAVPARHRRWTTIASAAKTIPEMLFMIYQMTFAIITVALVVGLGRGPDAVLRLRVVRGAVDAHRLRADRALGVGRRLALLMTPPALLDFAGGTVVHLNAGIAGLVAAYVVGKRHGYGTDNFVALQSVAGGDRHRPALGRLVRLQRRLGARRRIRARSIAIVATHLAACDRRADLDGAGVVDARQAVGARHDLGRDRRPRHHHAGLRLRRCPGMASLIGLLAGAICFWACTGLKQKLGYDDSLDVFGVHGVGGADRHACWRACSRSRAVGCRDAEHRRACWKATAARCCIQLYGIAVTVVWSGVATFIILKVIEFIVPLRVTQQSEIEGLDVTQHGESLQ